MGDQGRRRARMGRSGVLAAILKWLALGFFPSPKRHAILEKLEEMSHGQIHQSSIV